MLMLHWCAQAAGALIGGGLVSAARAAGVAQLNALRVPVLIFGLASALKAALYARLSPEVEALTRRPRADSEAQGAADGDSGMARARLCGVTLGMRPERYV